MNDWGNLFEGSALLLVAGGSLATAWLQNGGTALRQAFGEAGRLPTARQRLERSRLAGLVVEDAVRKRGIACADRVPQACRFTQGLCDSVATASDFSQLTAAVDRMTSRLAADRAGSARVWTDIADAAPAMGMMGTVCGLVQVFATMGAADYLGEAMALCLLTSLYGLALAYFVAGPLARRIARAVACEAEWQNELVQRMLALARLELADAPLPSAGWTGSPVPRLHSVAC